MMASPIYIPIVKAKENDLKAVGTLSTTTRNLIKPMIEVMPLGKKKDLDRHIYNAIEHLVKHVPLGDVYLDFYGLQAGAMSSLGISAISFGYELAKLRGRVVTPTYGFDRDESVWPEFKKICTLFNQGFCFRIDIDDIDDSSLSEETWARIIERSSEISLTPSEIDLMIDLRDVRTSDHAEVHEKVIDFLAINPAHIHYRTIIVAGSSAMKTLTEKPAIPKDGMRAVIRNELLIWGELLKDVADTTSLTFGDYGVIHPDFSDQSELGFGNTNAKIRYTYGYKIEYHRGHCLRKPILDYEQYQTLAEQVKNSESYRGREFSFGDKYLWNVADGYILPKATDPWIVADMNHHIEYTSRQMQKLLVEMKTREDLVELIKETS